MKLSKQAIIAAAVTGALPGVAQAAALNQNLVNNPSFENVLGTAASEWNGNVSTYAYAQNYTATGPAGGGNRYWFGGGAAPQSWQTFDLSANAAAIDVGSIGYNLSAFFSTYRTQRDFGMIHALFMNAASTVIGDVTIGGANFVSNLPTADNGAYPDARTWGQDSLAGLVPAGTRSIRFELDGTKEPNVGAVADSYIDLVNLSLVPVPEPGTMPLVLVGASLAGAWLVLRRRR